MTFSAGCHALLFLLFKIQKSSLFLIPFRILAILLLLAQAKTFALQKNVKWRQVKRFIQHGMQ